MERHETLEIEVGLSIAAGGPPPKKRWSMSDTVEPQLKVPKSWEAIPPAIGNRPIDSLCYGPGLYGLAKQACLLHALYANAKCDPMGFVSLWTLCQRTDMELREGYQLLGDLGMSCAVVLWCPGPDGPVLRITPEGVATAEDDARAWISGALPGGHRFELHLKQRPWICTCGRELASHF